MAATQFFLPYQAATINAIAEPGATLTFYLTGTTTKLPIYTTALLDTELANPIRANAAGRFADIYLDSTQTYRLLIKDRNGTALEDFDPYTPGTVIGFPSRHQLSRHAADVRSDGGRRNRRFSGLRGRDRVPARGWRSIPAGRASTRARPSCSCPPAIITWAQPRSTSITR
jgi:hypothetical protein